MKKIFLFTFILIYTNSDAQNFIQLSNDNQIQQQSFANNTPSLRNLQRNKPNNRSVSQEMVNSLSRGINNVQQPVQVQTNISNNINNSQVSVATLTNQAKQINNRNQVANPVATRNIEVNPVQQAIIINDDIQINSIDNNDVQVNSPENNYVQYNASDNNEYIPEQTNINYSDKAENVKQEKVKAITAISITRDVKIKETKESKFAESTGPSLSFEKTVTAGLQKEKVKSEKRNSFYSQKNKHYTGKKIRNWCRRNLKITKKIKASVHCPKF